MKLSELECYPYDEICRRSVLNYVPDANRKNIISKMQYEKVMEILSYKPEYSFTYECIIEECADGLSHGG